MSVRGFFFITIIVCFAYCVNPFVLRYVCVETCNVHLTKECSVFNLCASIKFMKSVVSLRYDLCDLEIG